MEFKIKSQIHAFSVISVLFLVCFVFGCKTNSSTSPDTNAAVVNSVFFDSLYTNVDVNSGLDFATPWSIGTATPIVNFRFQSKPKSNGTYILLNSDKGSLAANECLFFINHLDGVNSTSYFPKTTNIKTATVKITNGKINVIVEGIEMEGNRGGKSVPPVNVNLLEK